MWREIPLLNLHETPFKLISQSLEEMCYIKHHHEKCWSSWRKTTFLLSAYDLQKVLQLLPPLIHPSFDIFLEDFLVFKTTIPRLITETFNVLVRHAVHC